MTSVDLRSLDMQLASIVDPDQHAAYAAWIAALEALGVVVKQWRTIHSAVAAVSSGAVTQEQVLSLAALVFTQKQELEL